MSAPVQEVGITDEKEGTVNLQLRNFFLEGLGLIGDIFVYDVAITADGNISKTDNITIFGEMGAELGVLPLELTGKISQGNLSDSSTSLGIHFPSPWTYTHSPQLQST